MQRAARQASCACLIGGARQRTRFLGVNFDERAQLAISALDSIEQRIGELERGQLTAVDQLLELSKSVPGESQLVLLISRTASSKRAFSSISKLDPPASGSRCTVT
jgi:hypothetical protein